MVVQIAVRINGTKHKVIKRILIDPEADVAELQNKIQTEFGIPPPEQVLRSKSQGFEIRVIAGLPFKFYEIGNNSLIELYRLETASETPYQEHQEAPYQEGPQTGNGMNADDYSEAVRILNKLKGAKNFQEVYPAVIEEEEDEEDDTDKQVNLLKTTFWEITSNKNRKAFEPFYRQFMDTIDRAAQGVVLTSVDKVGWTGIHYAIRENEEWVIMTLIDNFAEDILSIQSTDGWTPLLLAVQNKSWAILEKLIEKATRAHLEAITSKGSVLHAIFKNCDFRIVQYLVSVKLVDPFFKDTNDVRAIDLLKPEHARHVETLLRLQQVPLKPPNLFFEVTKKSFFFGWATRHMYINSEARSLERYKDRSDLPFNPREVIPLHLIENLRGFGHFNSGDQNDKNDYVLDRRTGQVVEKSIYDKHDNFIEFAYNDERHSYRVHSTIHAGLALKTLLAAIEWSKFYELFISKLRGAEYESGIAVWKKVSVDFTTYDLMDPLQLTSLIRLEMKDDDPRQDAPQQIFQGLKQFYILKLIGRGAFGKVFKVQHRKTQKIFAMKVLNKKNLLRDNQIKYSMIEKEILQNNPEESFLLSLHFAFQTVENLFMVIDFCPNEDLSVLLNRQERNMLDEATARFYIAETFLAINDLHKRNYIYRDLKPENILIDEHGHIKLADFGLAAKNIRNATDFAKSFCGSPMYIAPEILRNKTAFKSTDYYTMGVVIFEMLTGEPPFYNENFEKLYSLIKKGDFRFPTDAKLSDAAKDLISRLICMPKKRLGSVNGFEDIKKHPFFAPIDWIKLQNRQLEPPLKFPPPIHNFSRPIKLKDTEYADNGPKTNFIPNFDFVRAEYRDS